MAPLRLEPLRRRIVPDERGRSYTWKVSTGRRGIAVLDPGGLRQACAAVAILAAIGRERRYAELLPIAGVWCFAFVHGLIGGGVINVSRSALF